MAYSKHARRAALRIVAEQGYGIAAGLTGISESTLRAWAKQEAEREALRTHLRNTLPGPRIGG